MGCAARAHCLLLQALSFKTELQALLILLLLQRQKQLGFFTEVLPLLLQLQHMHQQLGV